VNLHLGRRGALASIGLIVAATLWAVNMLSGKVLPYPACRHQLHLAGYSSLTAVVVSVIAGWCSCHRYRLNQAPRHPVSDARRSLALLSGLGAGAAALFLVALGLQTMAGFILTGCER
jgi:hypothetical protein